MSDQGHKTEKPTQRKLEKSRKEGQFVQTRELTAALQLAVLLLFAEYWGGELLTAIRTTSRQLISFAFRSSFDASDAVAISREAASQVCTPLASAGIVVLALTVGVHLAMTKMGFSLSALAPKAARFNPVPRLRQMPREGLFSAMWATGMFAATVMFMWWFLEEKFPELVLIARAPVLPGTAHMASVTGELVWKLGGAFCLVGAIDFIRRFREHESNLKMSRQEVRDEIKDSEGRPEVKQRVRALQRLMMRRQMMRAVPTATAVIVNPTHYAVAIRYEIETMAAPLVVAKGKDFLAQKIRLKALDHSVPIIENPPLARGLYAGAKVGDEIPPALYRAVAEVLAYVFSIMDPKLRK
jgi:flagellar biosynthetic protein FlhB